MNFLNWLATRQEKAQQLAILLFLCLVVLVLPAGSWDLRGPDEGRYTQIAKELLNSDNWFALTVMGKPYDQKPPLAFWLFAAALKLNGGEPHSWFLRMPSVLAAIGTLVCSYAIGRHFAGNKAGYLSGLFLLSSIAFLDDAPTVELNVLYTFFITATLTIWLLNFEKPGLNWFRALAFWMLLAAAFLIKGPLALLVVFSALGGTALIRKSWQPFRAVKFLFGLPLLLTVIGGWFWAQSTAFGPEFVEAQIKGETVERFLEGHHTESFWYYFPRIFTTFMGPWALILMAALVSLWKTKDRLASHFPPLLHWMALPFLVLLLANGKRVPYLLPLLPAACIISGIWSSQYLSLRPMSSRLTKVLVTLLTIAGAMTVIAGALILLSPDRIIDPEKAKSIVDLGRLHPELWILGGVAIIALAVVFARSARTWETGIWSVALAILTVQLLDFTTVRPAFDTGKSTRHFSDAVTALMAQHGETTLLATPDMAQPKEHVYGHYKVDRRRKESLNLNDPTLPRLLVLRKEEIETSGSEAQQAGYAPILDMKVAKNRVRVYLRDRPLPVNKDL